MALVLLLLAACGSSSQRAVLQTGMASFYGAKFEGRATASGVPFDPSAMTAAHRSLPFGTEVEVTRLSTGKSVVVRINDRGPYADGRILDLSRAAAQRLGFVDEGVAKVELRVVSCPPDADCRVR